MRRGWTSSRIRGSGKPITTKLDLDALFATFHRDPTLPKRMPFIAAKEKALAEEVVRLLGRDDRFRVATAGLRWNETRIRLQQSS